MKHDPERYLRHKKKNMEQKDQFGAIIIDNNHPMSQRMGVKFKNRSKFNLHQRHTPLFNSQYQMMSQAQKMSSEKSLGNIEDKESKSRNSMMNLKTEGHKDEIYSKSKQENIHNDHENDIFLENYDMNSLPYISSDKFSKFFKYNTKRRKMNQNRSFLADLEKNMKNKNHKSM